MSTPSWPLDGPAMQALLEASGDAHFVIRAGPQSGVEFVSDSIRELTGYDPADFLADPALFPGILGPDSRRAWHALLTATPDRPATAELAMRHRLGHTVWTHTRATVRIRDDGASVLIGSARDITSLRHAVDDLRESEARYRLLAENTSDFVMRTSPDRRIEFVTPSVTRALGWHPNEMVGRRTPEFIHPDDHETSRALSQRVNAGEAVYVQTRIRASDGSYRWFAQNVRPITDDAGAVIARASGWRDVTAEIEARRALEESQRALQFLANHDPLTGLLNRRELVSQLTALLDVSAPTQQVGLLLIDLDELKAINDTYGHLVGDSVIVEVARRARDAVRADDILARIGGDEFVVVTRGGDASAAALQIGRRLTEAMREPVAVGHGRRLTAALSVGVAAVAPHDDIESLLHRADQALYRAKRRGGGRIEADASAQSEA